MTPFRVGCHCRATAGNLVARLLVTETRYPLQKGHPVRPLVRLVTVADHSWSGPLGHFHHRRRFDPYDTSSGSRPLFRIGCHSATNLGYPDTQYFEPDGRRRAFAHARAAWRCRGVSSSSRALHRK